ncbi:hypothetical protein DFH08DRAFT_976281 [Mycena albidolilacea]|uniref:Uncharacterized protein n=1 Tax=Mycena albidolilacea TaxID=1033008 RepID=A0AAD7EAE8_9AGAR|nr:hypothetical protein DFH08DRAFT_976281 [Mycena albidolilacea]
MITQQKEPPTERMRRMYSCAVDLEVEDTTGRRERLVHSTHFRTKNVQEGPLPIQLAVFTLILNTLQSPPTKPPRTPPRPNVVLPLSGISGGFRFIQQTWADSANVVHSGVGVNPIIGTLAGALRVISGLDPINAAKTVTLTTDFVVSRGGECFFSPSLSSIATKLSV